MVHIFIPAPALESAIFIRAPRSENCVYISTCEHILSAVTLLSSRRGPRNDERTPQQLQCLLILQKTEEEEASLHFHITHGLITERKLWNESENRKLDLFMLMIKKNTNFSCCLNVSQRVKLDLWALSRKRLRYLLPRVFSALWSLLKAEVKTP